MMSKIVFNIVFLSVLLTTISCNKYLSLQPQDGITRQEYWKTKEQVQSAVVGCYASLLGDPTGADRPLSEYLFMWGEARADMIAPGPGITSPELDITNVNTLSTNAIVKWSAVYKSINFCNTVIDFAPGVLANDNTFTQAQLNAYLAEARGLRALLYFYLVRSFRDVPLVLKSTSSDKDLSQIAKTSKDSVLAQVMSDLLFADSNAVITYGSAATDKGRLTKYTIKAIEADVYLWMDKYTEAVAACDFIINSGQFGLVAGDDAWFNTLYYKGNSNESIFEFQYDTQKLNSFYLMLVFKPRYLASAQVMDVMYTVDYNNDRNKDIRGDGASVHTSDNAIWKYTGVTYNIARTFDAFYAHWFVYRYADILLMKAEALNQIGGRGVEALNLVYTIRNRAHALSQTDPNPDPNDQNALGDFILAERAREFAFEGKRWYDVLRNAKRNNYARKDILINMVGRSVPAELQQSAMAKSRDTNSHYFPIYYYEIQTDPNLIQNPYYK